MITIIKDCSIFIIIIFVRSIDRWVFNFSPITVFQFFAMESFYRDKYSLTLVILDYCNLLSEQLIRFVPWSWVDNAGSEKCSQNELVDFLHCVLEQINIYWLAITQQASPEWSNVKLPTRSKLWPVSRLICRVSVSPPYINKWFFQLTRQDLWVSTNLELSWSKQVSSSCSPTEFTSIAGFPWYIPADGLTLSLYWRFRTRIVVSSLITWFVRLLTKIQSWLQIRELSRIWPEIDETKKGKLPFYPNSWEMSCPLFGVMTVLGFIWYFEKLINSSKSFLTEETIPTKA